MPCPCILQYRFQAVSLLSLRHGLLSQRQLGRCSHDVGGWQVGRAGQTDHLLNAGLGQPRLITRYNQWLLALFRARMLIRPGFHVSRNPVQASRGQLAKQL